MPIFGALLLVGAAETASVEWVPHQEAKMRHYASCVTSVAGRDAGAMIAAPIASVEEHRLGQKIASDHPACLQRRGISVLNEDTVRGVISQHYIDRMPELLTVAAQSPDTPPNRPPSGIFGRLFLFAYAACLYRAAPQRTAATLRTELGSDQERSSVMAFSGLLTACMPLDASYHLDAEDLRLHMATLATYDGLQHVR